MITKKTMENILGIAELAFTTAKTDEEIKTPLLEYNYDDARLDQCLELHKKAKADYQKQIKERSEQFQATAELENALDEGNPVYIEHITLTRLALRNKPKKKSKFSLAGSRRKDIYGWIEQAEVYYDSLSEFFLVCKFALAHKPQLLERLGYLQLSEGYRRRENNPEEENESENEG